MIKRLLVAVASMGFVTSACADDLSKTVPTKEFEFIGGKYSCVEYSAFFGGKPKLQKAIVRITVKADVVNVYFGTAERMPGFFGRRKGNKIILFLRNEPKPFLEFKIVGDNQLSGGIGTELRDALSKAARKRIFGNVKMVRVSD